MFDLNKALKEKIQSMSTEALQAIVDKVEGKNITGPTVQEYLNGLQECLEVKSHAYRNHIKEVRYDKFKSTKIETFQSTVTTSKIPNQSNNLLCSINNDTFFGGNKPYPKAA
jgi:hypothetical protein